VQVKKPADAKHVMGEKPAADAKATAEGKCGNMMEGDKMKKGMEGACGEMMKVKKARAVLWVLGDL